LSDLAEACRGAFLLTSISSKWQPGTGSAAAAAKIDIERQDPAAPAKGILPGFHLVTEVVVTYLEVAANHLGGLGALYRSGEAMFSPLPVIRSILEYCAHAMWVLGDGTGANTDILARAYLEEFLSCESAKLAAERMGGDADAILHSKARWKEVRSRAMAAFPGTTATDLTDEKPGRTLAGQILPGPEGGVDWMFNHIYQHGNGSLDARQAKGVYAFLSGGTHASLYQARQMRRPVKLSDGFGTNLEVDIHFLEKLLALAVTTFYNSLSYAISFYDIDRSPHGNLAIKIDEILPMCFRSE
jgi:hypothetical protein